MNDNSGFAIKPNKKKSQKKENIIASKLVSDVMTFAQTDRLSKLPNIIERTEAEILKLEEFLSQPNLFTEYPERFQKATDALIERHEILAKLENEWIELEALSDTS